MKLLYPKLSFLSLALLIPVSFTVQTMHASASVAQNQPVLGIDIARMEVVKAAVEIIKSNKPGASELANVLYSSVQKKRMATVTEPVIQTDEEKVAGIGQFKKDLQKLTDTEIVNFTFEVREEFVKNLTLDHKVHLFLYFGDLLLGSDPQPFKIQLPNVNQFDRFILIVRTLLANESKFTNLVGCFCRCITPVGQKPLSVIRIMLYLGEIDDSILPAPIQTYVRKLKNGDMRQQAVNKNRIKHLLNH